MPRKITGLAALVLIGVCALAGCADDQPGDVNNGPGYTDNASDLLVKLPALQGDPCRTNQADSLFPNCGRYVTEVANTVAALRDDLPQQGSAVNALQNAVNEFQQLACDSVNGSATKQQLATCPAQLRAIGTELDILSRGLAAAVSSSPTTGD
ncbi:MAG TPA: hypothetical protein VHW44_26610 [Pseudonocardiaceae bacterium]|jgi:hypothetical protein|nr:hypothetical protein [Pseudonocardiaceae bacterium]